MNKYASIYIGSFNKTAEESVSNLSGTDLARAIAPSTISLYDRLPMRAGALGGLAGAAVGGIGGYLSGEDENEAEGKKGTRLRNALIGAGVLGAGGAGATYGVSNHNVNNFLNGIGEKMTPEARASAEMAIKTPVLRAIMKEIDDAAASELGKNPPTVMQSLTGSFKKLE